MVSLISWLINPFLKIIKVRRMPPAKALNANLLGLSLGLFLVLAATGFQYTSLFATQPWFNPVILLALFVAGIYFLGGFFTLIVAVSYLAISAPPAGSFLYSIKQLAYWNLLGYGFGAIFATLYNDLVFLYLILFEKDKIKLYAYFRKKEFNILKSPIKTEEKAFQELLSRERNPERHKKLEEELKLYDFELDEPPEQPYTILFVANSFVLERLELDGLSEQEAEGELRDHRNNPASYKLDPIINDRDLFYFSVDRALRSFERNEVLGRPEIWSRVRVVTLFDPTLCRFENDNSEPQENNPKIRNTLVGEFQGRLTIDGQSPLNLLDPLPEMNTRVEYMLDEYQTEQQPPDKRLSICNGDIDVVYALSAWPTHDRSTAHFSDYHEEANGSIAEEENNIAEEATTAQKALEGEEFTFDPDPHQIKEGSIVEQLPPASIEQNQKNQTVANEKAAENGKFYHEWHVEEPGRVALNVIGATDRTFIHEFAHAMSHLENGAITDEYADLFELESPTNKMGEEDQNPEPPFYVNRIERKKQPDGKFVTVHKVFSEYNCAIFHSDLRHPSAKENWLGYFPETHGSADSCIMDRLTNRNRFDKVISSFMYDRLVAKLNRHQK